MSNLNDKIREALRDEDADFLQDFDEKPTIFETLIEVFRGRSRWLTMMPVFWSFVFMALSVISAVKFFNTEVSNDKILWAVVFFVSMSGVMMMKVWFWMELNKNAITREIKRLELQIARLAGRMKD